MDPYKWKKVCIILFYVLIKSVLSTNICPGLRQQRLCIKVTHLFSAFYMTWSVLGPMATLVKIKYSVGSIYPIRVTDILTLIFIVFIIQKVESKLLKSLNSRGILIKVAFSGKREGWVRDGGDCSFKFRYKTWKFMRRVLEKFVKNSIF